VLDDEHRFFWTSGAHGVLRLLRCQRCGYYLHPPIPRCPRCGSRELAPEAVSGRGEVYSYTVNHQSWDGGTEPYVIVLVALPEQEGLRLTSNLYGCPPDDVRIGMPVQVVFEQQGEVWFPLWEPADEVER
jgi:uncharacterized OB-fold protein